MLKGLWKMQMQPLVRSLCHSERAGRDTQRRTRRSAIVSKCCSAPGAVASDCEGACEEKVMLPQTRKSEKGKQEMIYRRAASADRNDPRTKRQVSYSAASFQEDACSA